MSKKREISQEPIKVGDIVHCGMVGKGGAGFVGRVTSIEGKHVHITADRVTRMGFATYRGLLDNCTKWN